MEQKTIISSSMVNINGKEDFKQTAIKVKNGKKKGIENKNGMVRTIPKRELNSILNNMDNTRSKSFHSPFETLPFMNRVNLIVNELNDSMIPKISDRIPTPHPRKRKTRRHEKKKPKQKQKQTKKRVRVKKAPRKTVTEKKNISRNTKKTKTKKNHNNNYNANNNTN